MIFECGSQAEQKCNCCILLVLYAHIKKVFYNYAARFLILLCDRQEMSFALLLSCC